MKRKATALYEDLKDLLIKHDIMVHGRLKIVKSDIQSIDRVDSLEHNTGKHVIKERGDFLIFAVREHE